MRRGFPGRRRHFLRQLASVVAVGSMPPCRALANVRADDGSDRIAARLAGLLQDQESACRVGREYLRRFPEEGDAACLVAAICADMPQAGDTVARLNMSRLGQLVAQRLRADFEHGRVVNLRGWILGRTECRLCALASLM